MLKKGLIINNISNIYIVETKEKTYETTARGKFKKDDIKPLVGDIVEIEIINEEDSKAVINKINKRTTYLKRPKIANISQILLVVSLKMPCPDLLMLDKQLAFLEYLNIRPIIVLNKIDLEDEKVIENIENTYKNIGYDVIKTNAKTGQGVLELKEELKGNISAFAGNSGVGKSTLINGLFRNNITQEGDISQKNKRGKNTTTNISLYKIDNNSYIADTPGFSTFDIYEIESKNLEKYFIEFKKYIKYCEFIGCSHIKEQNCGIKTAIENGKISKERYERYIKIFNDIKDKEEHKW